MKRNLSNLTFTGLVLALLAGGCAPAPQREATEVKKASEALNPPVAAPAAPAPVNPAPQAVPVAANNPPAAPANPPAANPPANVPPSNPPVNPPVAQAPAAAAPVAQAPAAAPAAAAAPPADGLAVFRGRVVVNGTVAARPAKVKAGQAGIKDAICSEKDVPDPSVVISADNGLANVFVYLRRSPTGDKPASAASTPSLDQQGCVYFPHAQVMRIENPLMLKNSDPVGHNVHINSLANTGFNELVGANDKTGREFRWKVAETRPTQIVCDIHNWMTAWVLPVDHPWATVTDANGNFEIASLPDGEHEFTLWHEANGGFYVNRSLKVTAAKGKVIQETITVDAAKLAPGM